MSVDYTFMERRQKQLLLPREVISEDDWNDLRSALRFITTTPLNNQTAETIGYALLSLQWTRPARQLWIDFLNKCINHKPGKAQVWWAKHRRDIPRDDFRRIFKIARDLGWGKGAAA
jgi:hypothetical protein